MVRFNVSDGIIKDFIISTKEVCADLTDINTRQKFGKCSGNLIITHTTSNDAYDFDNYAIPFKNPDVTFFDSNGQEITDITRVTSGVLTLSHATFKRVSVEENQFDYSVSHQRKTIEGVFTPTKIFFYDPIGHEISKIVSQGGTVIDLFDEPVKEVILKKSAEEVQSNYPVPHRETIEGVFTSVKNANGTWRLQMDSKVSSNLICVYPLITWNATKVYPPTQTPTPITSPEGKEVEVPSPTFKPSPTPTVTPVLLTPTPIPIPSLTAPTTEIPTPEEKVIGGFKAVFAIAGLLAVFYLLRRK